MSRYLIDTSVWIDFFRQHKTPAVEKLYQLLSNPDNYGITELIYQEILQGALHEQDFQSLADYLISQTFFYPKHAAETYRQAAYLYFSCRRKGITIRSTIDCLIAQTDIEHNLILLHSDKDFLRIAEVTPQLQLYTA
jgi:predicted nucleic acid-binding protein